MLLRKFQATENIFYLQVFSKNLWLQAPCSSKLWNFAKCCLLDICVATSFSLDVFHFTFIIPCSGCCCGLLCVLVSISFPGKYRELFIIPQNKQQVERYANVIITYYFGCTFYFPNQILSLQYVYQAPLRSFYSFHSKLSLTC